MLEGLHHRQELGIHPPQFVITKVLEEMRNFVATPAEENILMVALMDKMKEADLPEDEQKRIALEAREAIETTAYPAYTRLIDFFEELDEEVEGNYGAWSLPDGEEYYRLALKLFTTTDYTPEFIHQMGLAEIDRIQAEILAILESEGWDVSSGFTAAIEEMSENPMFYYSDSGEGRDQILADYQAMIDEISEGLEPYFDVVPEAAVEVERVPEFKEKTSPGAYYNPPAMDGSRPGVFYANLYDIKVTPKFHMRTLAYHEAIPGHHLQIAIAQELEGVPMLRRYSGSTAFVEGWALYTERLCDEMGLYSADLDRFGVLSFDAWRACRLVVDTGIHAFGWSRQQAIDYLYENTLLARNNVENEVDRYIAWPGQALAYKIGQREILSLRDRAQAELGPAFSYPEFHDHVLENGAVSLETLRSVVGSWIDDGPDAK